MFFSQKSSVCVEVKFSRPEEFEILPPKKSLFKMED
jgi:hypothetical protein